MHFAHSLLQGQEAIWEKVALAFGPVVNFAKQGSHVRSDLRGLGQHSVNSTESKSTNLN